tara:strand:- start:1486 stop:1683 length:198 start_codon:yes stop_codon:yes gene_type:complete
MEDEEFYCQLNMNIGGLRLLYSHLEYSIRMWPGSPARPAEEQLFLDSLKKQTFAMICEYNLSEID